MKSRIGARLLIVGIMAAMCSLAISAQEKSKWNGTWKMVPEKTQFAGGEGPSKIIIKLDVKEGSVTETMTITHEGEDHSFTATYATDGKAVSQEVMGRTAQTTAKWDGDALIIDFKAEDGGFARKIKLSSDGKTMTIAVHHSGDQGERDETVVLEKQA